MEFVFTRKKRAIYIRFFQIIFFSLMMLSIAGCDMKDKIEDLTNVIDDSMQSTESILSDAIDMIDRNSNAWQESIRKAQSKLTSDTQSTIRNELNDVLQRGIAATGAEFRCNTDFIADRVRASLQRILARITGQNVPPVIPGICNVVPLAIDRSLIPERLKRVEFYGYDFDVSNIRTKLLNGQSLSDVSRHLSRPTHYHMVLNLGGNGVALTDRSQKIKLISGSTLLSEIPIIQESTPVCLTKIESIPSGTPITYIPRHTRGDREFAGHGPKINSTVKLLIDGSKIKVRLSMKAQETKKDWTTAEGSKEYVFYTSPSGWKIESIVGETFTRHDYLDDDHTEDTFNMGPGGLVKRIVYRGDRKGKDAGVYTQMTVTFNPVSVKLVQTQNCVSKKALHQLQNKNLISPVKLRAIRSLRPIRLSP